VVVATQDWHGQNDPSFKANGGIWPVHCEKGTEGADFPCADLSEFADVLIRKTEYSAAKGTGLAQLLISRGVKRVVVCGLALDYCVKATALDLSQALAEVIVPLDATAAVDPAEVQNVVRDLLNAGVTVTDTEELV
jgi:nicotinamidase/pyrazinamidase